MEAGGSLSRTRSPADEKHVLVALSEHGRAFEAEAAKVHAEIVFALGNPFELHSPLQRDFSGDHAFAGWTARKAPKPKG